MMRHFSKARKKHVNATSSCILVLQPSFRSVKRLQHLYFYLLHSTKNTKIIVLTSSLTTLVFLVLRGVSCRFYISPFMPRLPEDIDISNLNTLIPLAMTETAQHGRLKFLFNSKYLAIKSLISYACLSKILKKIASSYTNVQITSHEAALADHMSSYLLSTRYQSFHCKWISLISPSNLVGLTQGDPSKRRFLLDGWNTVNNDKTTRDYQPTSNQFILHSSSYLSYFENATYKLIQYISTAVDFMYTKIVILATDALGSTTSPVISDSLKMHSKPANSRKSFVLGRTIDDVPVSTMYEQKAVDHVVVHFMSSPGESFANTSSIMTDSDVIRAYLTSVYSSKIRFILKLHPHFENAYSQSDLSFYESMDIEIWDPRIKCHDYENILSDKRTVVTTAFGSIYLERILQGLPVFCFNDDMHIIKTPVKHDQFFCQLEEYISWYYSNIVQMSGKLYSSSAILDFYDPNSLYPAELINAITSPNP